MNRPSFEEIYMRLALLMSERSTCQRTNSKGQLMKVGCVITDTEYRRVLSVGYNGNASGLPNKCDSTDVGSCGCIHGESNATVSCVEPRSTKKIVFCSHLPCPNCSKLLIQLGGVQKVYYLNDYRIRTGLDFLTTVGIEHQQLSLSEKEPTVWANEATPFTCASSLARRKLRGRRRDL